MDNPDQTNVLLQALINEVQVVGFNEVIPSMNDIFIRVVEKKEELPRAAQQPN